jgi:mRNA interferase MazF
VKRGDVYWADLGPPAGRRPVLVLTRDAVIPVLSAVVVAPITRTIRGIASEVPVGRREGLPERSVVSCDNLLTVPKGVMDRERAGRLGPARLPALDAALRFALEIRY